MASFEGFKNIATGIGAVAAPIAVAIVGSYYTSAAQEREVSAKFVELAVDILAKDPRQTDQGVRVWATQVLDRYSGVQFSRSTRDAIVNRISLPTIVDTAIAGGSRPVAGARRIGRIIVRDTQQTDLQRELQGLQQGKVSYHYLIDQAGQIHRLKDENDVAFHTAGANADSIGIGVLHVSGAGDYTPRQIESLTALLRDIAGRRGIAQADILSASAFGPAGRGDFAKVREAVLAKAFPAEPAP